MRTKVLLLAVLGLASVLGVAAAIPSASTTEGTVAGRYYIRNRTQDFYRRARPKVHFRLAESGAEPQQLTIADESELLAGRYYIRNRTSNFFRRATPRTFRLIG